MIYGTHNSATGGKLLWWLKPLAWIINPTSKCQDRSIAQQLEDGVRLFNLQVAYVGGKWRFSHGLALYKEDIYETLALMKSFATKENPVFFQLYYDRTFWAKRDVEEFEFLIEQLKKICDEKLIMHYAWFEGTKVFYRGYEKNFFYSEYYWTVYWAKNTARKWYDKLPLPKFHAKRYNAIYKKECCTEYLMLDFYNYG